MIIHTQLFFSSYNLQCLFYLVFLFRQLTPNNLLFFVYFFTLKASFSIFDLSVFHIVIFTNITSIINIILIIATVVILHNCHLIHHSHHNCHYNHRGYKQHFFLFFGLFHFCVLIFHLNI